MKLMHVYAIEPASGEFEVQLFANMQLATSADNSVPVFFYAVTLQVFFEVHFPRRFERVFRRERAKVRALGSSASVDVSRSRNNLIKKSARYTRKGFGPTQRGPTLAHLELMPTM